MKKKLRMKETQEKHPSKIAPGQVIRHRRELLGWRAIDLARRSGLNPQTLDAIEKGRIESPSLKNLKSLATALGISVASLFTETEPESSLRFMEGSQKGFHTIEFPKEGVRIVCYTPFVPNVFVGKVIMKGEARIERRVLPAFGMNFVQVIMGKVAIQFDGKEHLIREGNYVFFDGSFSHSYFNPHFRECTFLLVTTPSFLSSKGNR